VTNPLDFQGPTPRLFVGVTDSLAERIQRLVPDAKVVKAFNPVPSAQTVDPKFSGGAPQMLIGGNDAAAKKKPIAILKEFGRPGAFDLGGIETARGTEMLLPVWLRLMGAFGHAKFNFKIVR